MRTPHKILRWFAWDFWLPQLQPLIFVIYFQRHRVFEKILKYVNCVKNFSEVKLRKPLSKWGWSATNQTLFKTEGSLENWTILRWQYCQGRIKGGGQRGQLPWAPSCKGAPRYEIYLFQIKYSFEKFRYSEAIQEHNSILYSYITQSIKGTRAPNSNWFIYKFDCLPDLVIAIG